MAGPVMFDILISSLELSCATHNYVDDMMITKILSRGPISLTNLCILMNLMSYVGVPKIFGDTGPSLWVLGHFGPHKNLYASVRSQCQF